MLQRFVSATVLLAITLASLPLASAHMAWLATDDQGHAIVWFGESPSDRTYHMPDAVASIKVYGGSEQALEMEPINSDQLVGLRSVEPVASDIALRGSVTYGLYHGTKLTYHVMHFPTADAFRSADAKTKQLPVHAALQPSDNGGLKVLVAHQGNAKADVPVTLYGGGEDTVKQPTDAGGTVQFDAESLGDGVQAVLVGVTEKGVKGTFKGQDYSAAADYLTVTFTAPAAAAKAKAADSTTKRPMVAPDSNAKVNLTDLPALPEELTSFGAAIAGDQLYVYGGHTGSAHSYSVEEQSDRLWGLDLGSETPQWKALRSGPRLQGLALVPYGKTVVRIGGFTAMNEAGEEHDLRSQTSVAIYQPAKDQWSKLPSLPEPRSSFDAAVLNDTVYVFGGWQLNGDSDSEWHQTAWSLDLSDADATWAKLPQPPFKRRAVSVAAHQGKLYVVGGMRSEGGPTTRVDVYDPKTRSWSRGPALPGSGMSGFGTAAFALQGNLYVNAMDGFVHRLGDGQSDWATIAKVEPSRFFHRMLPHAGKLLLIGGANMEVGKFTAIEAVELASKSK